MFYSAVEAHIGTPCLLDFPLANLDQTMFLPWLPETAPVVDSQKEDSVML